MDTLFAYRDKGVYLLHAYVLMPEHFHVLLTPSPEKSLERAVQYIKGASSHAIGEALRFQFPVWQPGFSDHRIRDAQDYHTHFCYIEQNAVRRRLVTHPEDYRWSSACGEFQMDDPPQRLKPRDAVESAVRRG